jgi:hypothetical protein
MRIKVHRGTPIHDGGSLCYTCHHSTITQGQTLDEEIVLCAALDRRSTAITFKVTACSSYMDSSLPTYWELMQKAWILQPGSRKRPAGFVRASELQDEEISQLMAGLARHDD